MRVAGILPCSFVNGEGTRYVVFLQGCIHHCKGCHNPETWPRDGGEEIDVQKIADDFKFRNRKGIYDGITLSGGEPFIQQTACIELLKLLPDVNVWIYTGYDYEQIMDAPLAKYANTLVTGPFVAELKVEGKLYGSSNQEIHHIR